MTWKYQTSTNQKRGIVMKQTVAIQADPAGLLFLPTPPTLQHPWTALKQSWEMFRIKLSVEIHETSHDR